MIGQLSAIVLAAPILEDLSAYHKSEKAAFFDAVGVSLLSGLA